MDGANQRTAPMQAGRHTREPSFGSVAAPRGGPNRASEERTLRRPWAPVALECLDRTEARLLIAGRVAVVAKICPTNVRSGGIARFAPAGGRGKMALTADPKGCGGPAGLDAWSHRRRACMKFQVDIIVLSVDSTHSFCTL